ncbi:MAG: GHKL domain-containing protein [Flavobacteriales bacterium]|nr:GHKL domain-containing protein [Flavobacteriales bacterium]MBP6696663.1 GHKL domain-containing protein [Flavobacteriales bacterium]
MKALRACVTALFLGWCAASYSIGPGPVDFHDDRRRLPIGKSLEIFSDTTGSMDLEDVIRVDRFEALGMDVPNLGVTSSTFWVRTLVRNESSYDHVVLSLEYAEIDALDLYLSMDGRIQRLAAKGQSVPAAMRSGADPEFAFDLPIPKGRSGQVFMRMRSTKQLQLPIVLRTPQELTANRSRRNLILGVYIGIMVVMALYNLFIFFSIRDKSYLYYVLYILSVTSTQLAFTGIGPFYLWPGNTWLSTSATVILTLCTATLGFEFARQFIHTRRHTPLLHRIGPVFYILFAGCIFLQQTGQAVIAYQMAQGLSGISALYVLAMAFLAWRRGSRQAFFFLMAWSAFLIGVVVFVVKDLGALPYNDLTTYTMPIGSAIECVLLSFGLADRINILRREKEQSQAEALRISLENERIIREQNAMLEVKVTERTLALQESNDHLKRTQTQLVNAEKMASLGQLTAGIAHEINNPVNFISSNIPPLRRDIGDVLEVLAEYRERGSKIDDPSLAELRAKEKSLDLDGSITELDAIIRSIEEGAGRTAEIVRGLRNFSRLDEDDLKLADLNEGIQSTLLVLAPQLKERVRIDLDLEALPPVECHPGKLNQVFMNILNNAVQAILEQQRSDEGRVQVSSRVVGDQVVISISDDGPGISPSVIGKIFDPFFTTKDVGAGTGLGLSIAFSIIEKHHGKITVDSIPGGGATFHVTLPLAQTNEARKRA